MAEQLEALGLVAAPEPVKAQPLRVSSPGGRSWPDYQRCAQGAPPKHGGNGPDISRAIHVVPDGGAARPQHRRNPGAVDEGKCKGRENGENYTRLTAENAAAAVARNCGRNRA